MDEPVRLYVGSIFNVEEGTFGLETNIPRIIQNLRTMFTTEDLRSLELATQQNPGGVSVLNRFCQFVFYLYLSSNAESGSMTFFDCMNNMDTALDIHFKFSNKGIEFIKKEEFINQFLEIREEYEQVKNAAILTTEEI